MSQDDQPRADGPQAGSEDYAGTPRPDAVMAALDEGQLAALREIGREWDQLTADPQVWREALPVDPALGGYPKDSDFRHTHHQRGPGLTGRSACRYPRSQAGERTPLQTPVATQALVNPRAIVRPTDGYSVAKARTRLRRPILLCSVPREGYRTRCHRGPVEDDGSRWLVLTTTVERRSNDL
jgi:hypothetical protein